MHDPSFLPGFEGFASARHLSSALKAIKACTLARIEEQLGRFVPADLLCGQAAPARPYSQARTFWCLIFQILSGNCSCNEVVRQLQALLLLVAPERRPIDSGNSAYCQARARLPLAFLQRAMRQSAQCAAQLAPAPALRSGHRVWIIDGTTCALPDTPQNREAFPRPKFHRSRCGFPLMRVLTLCQLQGAAVLDVATGDYRQHELRLLQQFMPHLDPGDLVIYDRLAGNFVVAATLQRHGVHLISRVAKRRIDFRPGQRLGKDDALFQWPKGAVKSLLLNQAEWDLLPATVTVRVIRVRVENKGFRSRELLLVTTLLDPALHPAAQIALAYLHRWRIELCMKDLKVTLGMDHLRCLSPQTLLRELHAILVAHNLVRCVMAQAAATHHVPIERISFKGTLGSFRLFAFAMAQASTRKTRSVLWRNLLLTLAQHQVPFRPGRREPRVVKRRPKSYPRMNKPRHEYHHLRAPNAY